MAGVVAAHAVAYVGRQLSGEELPNFIAERLLFLVEIEIHADSVVNQVMVMG